MNEEFFDAVDGLRSDIKGASPASKVLSAVALFDKVREGQDFITEKIELINSGTLAMILEGSKNLNLENSVNLQLDIMETLYILIGHIELTFDSLDDILHQYGLCKDEDCNRD